MLSKIHLVAKRSGVLGLDACVAQQRLENNLRVKKNISRHKTKTDADVLTEL